MGRRTVTQLANQIKRVLGHYTWLVTHLARDRYTAQAVGECAYLTGEGETHEDAEDGRSYDLARARRNADVGRPRIPGHQAVLVESTGDEVSSAE